MVCVVHQHSVHSICCNSLLSFPIETVVKQSLTCILPHPPPLPPPRPPASMYKSGITPYPAQPFHYGPRHVGPSLTSPAGLGPAVPSALVTQPGSDGPPHGPSRPPAPYGLISDLNLAVPTGESVVICWSLDATMKVILLVAAGRPRLTLLPCVFQAGLNGHLYKMPEIPESFPELCDMK